MALCRELTFIKRANEGGGVGVVVGGCSCVCAEFPTRRQARGFWIYMRLSKHIPGSSKAFHVPAGAIRAPQRRSS